VLFRSYPFPGNVREMENILERAVALASGEELLPDDLMLPRFSVPNDEAAVAPLTVEPPVPEPGNDVRPPDALPDSIAPDGIPADLQAYVDAIERDAIYAALEKTHFNRTAAAQLLGITFRQLRYRMQRLGVK
jgi:two-component system response regulator PilR (NtrC family)